MKFRFLLFVIILNTSTIHAFQNPISTNSQLEKITKTLDDYVRLEGPEKTYLHTDKDVYRPGDTIWFKTYLVDGITHKRSDKSRVAYVELLNAADSILARRILYIEGTSSCGSINLPNNLVDDKYKLRTYTKYILSDEQALFYQKSATISRKREPLLENNAEESTEMEIVDDKPERSLNPSNKTIKVEFFPEGGNLVAGLSGGLAIKISDLDGIPIAAHGTISDSSGNVITDFNSNNYGLGIVYFMPEPDNSYFALIENNGFQQRFEISKVLDRGFSLSIKNRGDNILIQVETTDENVLDGTILIGHLRGKKIFERLEKKNGSKSYAVKLLTKDLPDGIADFTLFSVDGKPVCERLVFIENPSNDTKVSIRTNSSIYGKREKVQLTIAVEDVIGRPIKGDFSMRVSSSMVSTNKSDMKNWLLLNSDLKGPVYDSDVFNQEDSNKTRLLLDAIMLTHQWERFSWNDLLSDHNQSYVKFGPEKGIMIRGTALGMQDRPIPEKSMISLNILAEAFEEKKAIDENGKFSFGPYFFNDSITAILQIVNNNKTQNSDPAKINIDNQWPRILSKPIINNGNPLGIKNPKIQQSDTSHFQENSIEEYDSKITYLDEVVVKEKRKTPAELIEKEINSFTPYGGHPDIRVFRDSIKGWEGLSAIDLLARKGIRVIGDYPNQKISLSGGSPNSKNFETGPLVLLDGTPVDGILGSLRASEVLFIDVLRFASASFYGVRGSSGVIAVYTNRTLRNAVIGQTSDPRITSANIMGFDEKLEFYIPDYSGTNRFNTSKDNRTTLYWNPNVKIDSEGQGKVQFYTSDRTGKFTVEFIGLTEDGEIVYGSNGIEVSNQE